MKFYNFKTIIIAFTLLVFFPLFGQVRGDGISIEKELSLKDVITRSSFIISSEIIEIKNEYGYRQAYGENRRYVTKYSFKVKILKVFLQKKQDNQEIQLKVNDTIWVHRRGMMIPGKWVLIPEYYKESYNLDSALKGDKVIFYGSKPNQNFSFLFVDKLEIISQLEKLFRE